MCSFRRLLPLLLLLCPTLWGGTPTFVQRNSDPNTGNLGTINDTRKVFPNGTKSGNTVLVVGITDNNPIGNVSVSDDKSDSYGLVKSLFDSTGTFWLGTGHPMLFAYVSASVASGAQAVTITQSTGGNHDTQVQMEWDNLSATVDGTCSATVTSGTSIACGSFTPTTSGDLICQFTFVESFSAAQSGSMTWTPATTGTTLAAVQKDGTSYFMTQCGVQSVAAAINPTVTVSSAVTRAVTIGFALKSATSGSTPSGLYLDAFDIINTPMQTTVTAGTSLTLEFPCKGNFVALNHEFWHTQGIASITDTNSNTWTSAGTAQGETGGTTANEIGWWYAANATCNDSEKLTINLAAAPNGDGTNNRPIFAFYDFLNAGGFDSTAGVVGSFGNSAALSGTLTWGSSITPSQNNSAIICGQQEANDSVTSIVSSGSMLAIILNHTSPNINELDLSDKDGGYSVFYQSTAAAYTPSWGYSNTNSGTAIGDWWGQCIAVKPVSAGGKTCTLTLMGAGPC